MAAANITYSPATKMDLSVLDQKALHNMKYHQLIKLSHKFNVNKRWAKKDELIQSLLKIKTIESQNKMNEETAWVDGGKLFAEMKPPEKDNSSRGTFTVEKFDLRATYNLTDKIDKLATGPIISEVSDRRLTFNIPSEVKIAALKKKVEEKPQVKMLTVPYTRVPSRSSSVRHKSVKESPLKLSNKSITIRKSKVTMSPVRTSRIFLPENKSLKTLTRPSLPKRPSIARKIANEAIKTEVPKENIPVTQVQGRRKSKSDNPEDRRLLISNRPVEFRTPPINRAKKTTSIQKNSNPPDKPKFGSFSGVKPFQASKVPDFAKLHQREFDKMDSLDEYIAKKSDRVKKLFGTPQVVKSQASRSNNVASITPRPRGIISKEGPAKVTIDEARKMINRNHLLRTHTDVKDKNRSHIHGIRTNKRFELQMKFRNML